MLEPSVTSLDGVTLTHNAKEQRYRIRKCAACIAVDAINIETEKKRPRFCGLNPDCSGEGGALHHLLLKVAARVKSYDASLEVLQHLTSQKAERLLESFESVL